jgi:hypothetical protein
MMDEALIGGRRVPKLDDLDVLSYNSDKFGDCTRKDVDEFWEKLDIAPVNEIFSKMLGANVRFKKVRLVTLHDGDVFYDKNDNIMPEAKITYELQDDTNILPDNPVTKSAWKLMRVRSTNSFIRGVPAEMGLRYTASISLQCQDKAGTFSNAPLGSVYFVKGEWRFDNKRLKTDVIEEYP